MEKWCKLTHFMTQFSSLLLEFRNFESMSLNKKLICPKNAGKKKSLKLVKAHKYKTSCLRKPESQLYIIDEKVNNPLSVEDLLKDTVIETVFPNIRKLLKTCLKSLEAPVEWGFSKMGRIITENVCHWKITF